MMKDTYGIEIPPFQGLAWLSVFIFTGLHPALIYHALSGLKTFNIY
jgi:hypothetical protein